MGNASTQDDENLTENVLPELRGYPPVMNSSDVAKLLGVSRHTVARMVNNPVPAFYAGRELRFLRSNIQRLLLGEFVAGASPDDDA